MAGLGGFSAVFHIIDGLSGTVATMKDLQDAPSQVGDFELLSSSFSNTLLMFYEVANQHIPLSKNKIIERVQLAQGLIRQSERVEKGLKGLSSRLEEQYNGATGPVMSLKLLWERVRWVLKQREAERLKMNMNLATVQMSCFMNMLVLDTKEAAVVEDGIAKKRIEKQIITLRAQMRRQLSVIRSLRCQIQEFDTAEPSPSRGEKREARSIMEGVKRLENSLEKELNNDPRPETPTQFTFTNPQARQQSSRRSMYSPRSRDNISSRESGSNRTSEFSHRRRPREHRCTSKSESSSLDSRVSRQGARPLGRDSRSMMEDEAPQHRSEYNSSNSDLQGKSSPKRVSWVAGMLKNDVENHVPNIPNPIVGSRDHDDGKLQRVSGAHLAPGVLHDTADDSDEDMDSDDDLQDGMVLGRPDRFRKKNVPNLMRESLNVDKNRREPELQDPSTSRSGGVDKPSRRTKDNDSTFEQPDASCASASQNGKRSRSARRSDDRSCSIESSARNTRSPSRNRSVSESSKATKAKDKRSTHKSSEQTMSQTRAGGQVTTLDYKGRKELQHVAEKRSRDADGPGFSYVTEDVELGRKKRRSRRD